MSPCLIDLKKSCSHCIPQNMHTLSRKVDEKSLPHALALEREHVFAQRCRDARVRLVHRRAADAAAPADDAAAAHAVALGARPTPTISSAPCNQGLTLVPNSAHLELVCPPYDPT